MTREQAVKFLIRKPYKFGHLIGFDKLTELHNAWMHEMICGKDDYTLQSHRLSYKTTCVSIAIALIMILMPLKRIFFLRKTDDDIKEIVSQVKKILQAPQTPYFVHAIYGVNLRLTKADSAAITTNLTTDTKGTSQLTAQGIGGSLTGKHFDIIFTDDIVNLTDRISKPERERTKAIYQELQNIKMRDGKIFNTGTPWHEDDAFKLMPEAHRYDCYVTGLISDDELANIRDSMSASLFAANYELRHVAAEDVIFTNPQTDADPAMVEQGEAHIDAAYGGEDFTAYTLVNKRDGLYYVFGKLWGKHIDDCLDEIQRIQAHYNAGRIFCEDNGDKGYLAKELRRRGERAFVYHENQNKYIKITSYLKAEWRNVRFVSGTDKEYINQICDYNENAEHDDAPDSLASSIRRLWSKTEKENITIFR